MAGLPQTGALVRLMDGEDFSSTDLHLAANDSLLVGQVAEMTPVEGQDPNRAASVHHRKLQVQSLQLHWSCERFYAFGQHQLNTSTCTFNKLLCE